MLDNKTNEYKEGIHAYLNGLSINDNPHFLGSSQGKYSQWADGFFDTEEIMHNSFDINEETKTYIDSLSSTTKEEKSKSPFYWIYK